MVSVREMGGNLMTLNFPTDGHAAYETIHTTDPTAHSRLDQIASAGFQYVLNYTLIYDHASDMISYINYAYSIGLKVIVALNSTVIWRDSVTNSNAIQTTFPRMYADSGNQNTDTGFTTYIVNQVKNLPGLWGYYLADEVVSADHANVLTHANAVKAADPNHPRLIIEAASAFTTSACFNNTSLMYDCCDVIGDDFYPVGDPSGYGTLTTAQIASGIQNYCNLHSLDSAIAIQTFSWSAYGRPGQPWPTQAQMMQFRNDAMSNMFPRLILWYSYFDIANPANNAPALEWTYVRQALQGHSEIVMFPSAVRRGLRR